MIDMMVKLGNIMNHSGHFYGLTYPTPSLMGIYNMLLMNPQPGRWYKVKFVAGCCSVFLAKTVGSQCAQTRKHTPNLEYIAAKIDRQLLLPNRHFEPISFQSFRILYRCFSNSSPFRFPVGLLFLYLILFQRRDTPCVFWHSSLSL